MQKKFNFNCIDGNGKRFSIQITKDEVKKMLNEIRIKEMNDIVRNVLNEDYPLAFALLGNRFEIVIEAISDDVLSFIDSNNLSEDDINLVTVLVKNFSNRILNPYKEVKNGFFNDDKGCLTVDAWRTNDDSEEGCVVAEVYGDGTVKILHGDAYHSLAVLEAIKEILCDPFLQTIK